MYDREEDGLVGVVGATHESCAGERHVVGALCHACYLRARATRDSRRRQTDRHEHRLVPVGIDLSGPARGNALLVTKYSPTGTKTRGTLNNCGTGKTPWGTFLTGEENWFGYFTRGAADDAARGNDKSVTSLKRYGRSQGAASRHGWETGGADDKYQRWNNSKTGASANGSDDYRNEMNGMGYIVEIDAYDKTRMAKKRTALGRFAHESAAFGKAVVGQPLSIYMGDDSRGEYIYKFVTTAVWSAADANPTDRMAVGDKYLDSGKLYAAKFNADGTGQWLELTYGKNGLDASNAAYPFADQGDVVTHARLAADKLGAMEPFVVVPCQRLQRLDRVLDLAG